MDPSADLSSRPPLLLAASPLPGAEGLLRRLRHKRLPRFGFGTDTRLVKLVSETYTAHQVLKSTVRTVP